MAKSFLANPITGRASGEARILKHNCYQALMGHCDSNLCPLCGKKAEILAGVRHIFMRMYETILYESCVAKQQTKTLFKSPNVAHQEN